MPHLSDKQYIRIHKQLRRFWLHDQRLYAELLPSEQWQLHGYFQPSKDISDAELLAHRQTISQQHPSLPHQAGRALGKFYERTASLAVRRQRAKHAPAPLPARRHRGAHHITVKSVVRPEIDVNHLARAVLAFAKEQAQQDQAVAKKKKQGQ